MPAGRPAAETVTDAEPSAPVAAEPDVSLVDVVPTTAADPAAMAEGEAVLVHGEEVARPARHHPDEETKRDAEPHTNKGDTRAVPDASNNKPRTSQPVKGGKR